MNVVAIGHNQPPSPIEYARDAMDSLATFLANTPVIQTIEQAKDGALLVERSRKNLQDLDAARRTEVDPLNEQVRAVNEQYKAVRSPFENVLDELRRRLTDYTAREEAKRIAKAEAARKAAAEAERLAREAEAAEHDAKSNASFGEVVDVAEKIVAADQAFSRFQKLDRAAELAEHGTSVRLPSQLGGKALSLRTTETLDVVDPISAINAIGYSQKIMDAIATAARDYRKKHGKLPAGVVSVTTRQI